MYIILSLAGVGAFSLTSLVVGVRLCLLAARTGERPELLLGLSFLLGGLAGNVLFWGRGFLPEASQVAVVTAARAFIAAGCFSTLLAAKLIFRPRRRWATAAVGAGVALLLSYVSRPLWGELGSVEILLHPLFWTGTLALILPYGWLSVESLLQQTRLRRRARLGLPQNRLLADRMLLWAIGLGSIALSYLIIHIGLVFSTLFGLAFPSPLISAGFGMICALCVWLAFFPPCFYRRRLGEGSP